jgi:plastocyanin
MSAKARGKLLLVLTVSLLVTSMVACTSNTSTTATPANVAATPNNSFTVNITAEKMTFDVDTITVPPGAAVILNFNNKDSGIPHNFAVYTDSSATQSIFVGQIITGPATTVYQFTAPANPGNYFFRCDVHPTQMTGMFIVK